MNQTLKVNGMMCEGCEQSIKKALEDINGIKEVKASHITGEVKIIFEKEININMIKNIIEELGYEIDGN